MTSGPPLQLVPRGRPSVRRFCFGTFALDVELGELSQAGVKLPLHGQPLLVLELLLASPGALVTREQLRRALWPDGTIVEFDDGLNNCVRRLRQALGDDATRPTFIETIPRRGYRFLGEVTAETGTDALAEPPAAKTAPHQRTNEPERHDPSTPDPVVPAPLDGPRPLSKRSHRGQRPILLALLVASVLALAYLVGLRVVHPSEPVVRRLTTRRGLILGGRFAQGGDRVIFDGAWEGEPPQPYVLSTASLEFRPLGIPDARVLAVSSRGEVALALHPLNEGIGLLATVPDVGGSPRELLENVYAADWSPDGKQLAVVRYVEGKSRLEFPIGTVVYESPGRLYSPRVSRRGEVAFARHPAHATAGDLLVWEPSGRVRTLVEGWGHKGGGVLRLAWAPSEEELWFTGNREEHEPHSLWAVTRSGTVRSVLRPVGSVMLMDIAPDGRVLLQQPDFHTVTEVSGVDSDQPRQVWDSTELADIARDGTVLVYGLTFTDPLVRKVDGSPPVRLGIGMPLALSPDGKWALVQRWEAASLKAGRLFLLPTGPGTERAIPVEPLEDVSVARWFPDGAHVAVLARESESPGYRFYVIDLTGGRPRPVSPFGVRVPYLVVSPDGQMLAGLDREGSMTIFPLDGGAPRAIPGLKKGLVPVGWSEGGGLLVIPEAVSHPVLSRVDVRTGKVEPITVVRPTDPVGVTMIRRVRMTPDERILVFFYPRLTGYLNLVESPRAR